jgi:oxygen-independent coproporphyrinogen-3 oxidase
VAIAEQRGLLVRDLESIRPTELGRRFLSDLQALFLPCPASVR